MKKTFFLFCAGLLLAFSNLSAFKAPTNGVSDGGELNTLSDKLYSPIKDKENLKLAVMEFPYTDGRKSEGPVVIQERLTTILAQKKNLSLIERSMLKKIMEEMKVQNSGLVDAQKATEIGNMLGADYLLLGTLNDTENGKTEINSRIVEVKTGKIISAAGLSVEKTWKDSVQAGNGTNYSGKALAQIAILLDTSGSMDGLINQTRSYIWKIVNELSAAEKNGSSPMIEVALYEYGNDSINRQSGFIRQVSPFTNDLDKISRELFNLKTNGGDEYCGWVIKDAVNNLKWSNKDDVYKAIFIAGNEPFTQGPVKFEDSAAAAKAKGIFVNTVYCGPRQMGVATKWKTGAELADGDFSNIDQNIETAEISAPQDDKISALNSKLNSTYIPYGSNAGKKMEEKESMDSATLSAGKGVAFERASYQASAPAAKAAMSSWDLISAIEIGAIKKSEVKKNDLPENLRAMTPEQLNKYIDGKLAERETARKEITRLSEERKRYIEDAQKKAGAVNTLDKAVINSLRKQAQRKGFKFKGN